MILKKIEGHIHLIRAMAGSKGQGRLSPLGNGYAIWDDGEIIHLLGATMIFAWKNISPLWKQKISKRPLYCKGH